MRRRAAALGAVLGLAVAAAPARGAEPPAWQPDAPGLQVRTPQPGGWREYVTTPSRRVVPAARVLGPAGADALLRAGDGRRLRLEPGESVVADFGDVVGGHLRLATGGPATVRAAFSETLTYLGPGGDSLGADENPGIAFGSATGIAHTVTAPAAGEVEDRLIRGAFRYVRLTADGGPAELDAVAMRYTPLPGRDLDPERLYRGRFLSDDDELNRFFYASAHTFDLNLVAPQDLGVRGEGADVAGEEVIVDGPKRDRYLWAGDLYISGLIQATTFGDARPVLSTLAGFASRQQASGFLPACVSPPATAGSAICTAPAFSEYVLYWALAVADAYQATGDIDAIRPLWPTFRRAMAWAEGHVGADGLFTFSPRAMGFNFAVEQDTGAGANVNWLLARAREQGAELATALGEPERAGRWRRDARELVAAIDRRLWNERIGAYGRSTAEPDVVAEDANVLPIVWDLMPAQRRARALRTVRERLSTPYGNRSSTRSGFVPPFMNAFEVAARMQSGDAGGAFELLRRTWGWMLSQPKRLVGAGGPVEPAGTTGWEHVMAAGTLFRGPHGSLAHAWSAGPAWLLPRYVAGVQPTAPGHRTWRLDPRLGGLRWVEATVPTPSGAIRVRHEVGRRAGRVRRYAVDVEVPAGTTAAVHVPVFGASRRVVVDRRRAVRRRPGAAPVRLGPGRHRIRWSARR
jgi:hypothetical protein